MGVTSFDICVNPIAIFENPGTIKLSRTKRS